MESLTKKVQTPSNYKKRSGKTFTQPSVTQPNRDMGLRQMLINARQGVALRGNKPLWGVHEPDFRRMDLVDLQNMNEEVKARNEFEFNELKRQRKNRSDGNNTPLDVLLPDDPSTSGKGSQDPKKEGKEVNNGD